MQQYTVNYQGEPVAVLVGPAPTTYPWHLLWFGDEERQIVFWAPPEANPVIVAMVTIFDLQRGGPSEN